MSPERAMIEPTRTELVAPRVADDPAYPPPPSAGACATLVPCRHGETGCPLGVDIPAVARALAGGDHEAAFRMVRAAHPFASSCGNACYAPCESACRRRPFGAPVAIAALEEFAASFAAPEIVARTGPCGSRFEARSVAGAIGRAPDAPVALPRLGTTIAIVGAGPTGMACAHDLSLLGHRSVIFDTRPEPGGLMTSGIQSFRFPVASARAECAAVLGSYAEFRGGATVPGLGALLESGFDAVAVAIGASRAARSPLELPERHPEILDAWEVLVGEVAPAGATIVAGEGALAIDAARTLARRGAVIARDAKPSIELVLTTRLDAPAVTPSLLAACARDGIRVHYEWRMRRVQVDAESGMLSSIDIATADDASARVLACDRLVVAAARVPDTSSIAGELDLTLEGFIATDPGTLRTSMAKVWAGGACVFGHRSIAHAVADGKRMAWEIHASLTGGRVRSSFASAWVEANGRGRPDRAAAARRRALPLLDPPVGEPPYAPASPRAASHAGEEAARCFDCAQVPVVTGECTNCGHCTDVCPTGAISIVENHAVIGQEICNRCGKCIGACPEDALTMLRAEWEERLTFA
jgi:NADPH-dependent glutamate synthase beta subunit-like oxidoreductase/ferredoxin